MNLSLIVRSASALAMGATLAACSAGMADEAAAPVAMQISVAHPEQQDVPMVLELPGHVEAVQRVELRPRVHGYVERVAFSEGSRIERGQLLFQIDSAPYRAALAAADAKLRQAEAEARLAANEAARVDRLLERRAISGEEAERRQARAAVSAAVRDAARAEVSRARIDLEHTRIEAPIDGRIGRAKVTVGNLVDASDVLAVLVADAEVYVRFDVAEAALNTAPTSAWTAQFTLPERASTPFTGTFAFLENEINSGTGTVRARLSLAGDPLLLPGRYGQVQLTLGEKAGALLVDEKVIGADQGTRYVLVVGEDNAVQYRPVQVGPRIGDRRVINQGIEPTDRIVVAGLMALRPGMVVSPQLAEPAGSKDLVAATPIVTKPEG